MQTLLAWDCPSGHDVESGLQRVEAWYSRVDPQVTIVRAVDSRQRRGLALWHDAVSESRWPAWWSGRGSDSSAHSVATLYAPLGFASVTGSVPLADAPGELGWQLIRDPSRIRALTVPLVLAQIHSGDLHLTNDVLGVGRLFETHHGDVTVWSNRPVAAMLFAGRVARADETAWAYQGAVDWCMGSTSPYEGVACIEPGSHIVATDHGIHRSSISMLEAFDVRMPADHIPQSVIDEVAGALVAAAQSLQILWPSQPPMLGLSGGKDSRLIAAALIAADVDFTCRTNNTIRGEGDAARALITALPESRRPRHELFQSAGASGEVPRLDPDAALDRADRWHDLTEGLRSPIYLSANPPRGFPGAGRPILNGSAGEIARGNYYPTDLHRVEDMPAQRRWAEYASILSARICLPHGLSAESRTCAERRIVEVLTEARNAGINDARALDWFYLHERVRRWGTFPESQVTITPLLTPAFVGVALAIPPALRPTAELHRRVTEALVPEWTGIDYFDANLKTRGASRRRRLWQEPDVGQITAILERSSGWPTIFDADSVRSVWARALGGSAGERDDLLLSRVIWQATFDDHCARVNGASPALRPTVAPTLSGQDPLAGARRAATRLNDVGWARRIARTRLGRRIRRILGV